jgi:hypothetical protein
VNERSSPVSATAIAMIDRRLEDLAEANALYGKDQRLSAPDKIARNEREISWLKDLRSELVMIGHAQTPAVQWCSCKASQREGRHMAWCPVASPEGK